MKHWKKTITTAALSAVLLTNAAYPVWAAEAASPAPAAIQSYVLTDSIEVEVKSLLNERTSEGTKLGVVVRMKNTGSKVARVPDYEIRLRTSDGIDYTLQPSAGNAKAIQAKTKQELSYMALIDRTDDIAVSELSWVDVDVYVYPKKETSVLTLPLAAGMAWSGSSAAVSKPSAVVKWGESFTLPALQSPIVYRPIDLHKDLTEAGPINVIKIQASNPSKERHTIPAFAMDGKTDAKVYAGAKAESITDLEPGETKYIHMIIPAELDTEFTSLNVVTPESFVSEKGAESYSVGRLQILLPERLSTGGDIVLPKYELGQSMKLDALSNVSLSFIDAALMELHMSQNEGDGFNTAVAKFKLTNKSDRPIPAPAFQVDLASKDGYVYSGTRQKNVSARIVPNGSTVVSYSFVLPASEKGQDLKLGIYNKHAFGTIGFNSILAAYQVQAQEEKDASLLKVYPFDVKIKDWSISAMFLQTMTYNYRMKLNLDITQDLQVVTDMNNTKLQFDLLDNAGGLVGTTTQNLSGMNRLLSGDNTITLNVNSLQLDFPLTVKVYEVFENENGEVAKRLLTTLKQ